MSLPKSFNLSEPIPSLPDGVTSTLISVRPISGSTFSASQIVEFDLGNRGWLIPDSLAIRYRQKCSSGAATAVVAGTPVFTPFVRLNTLVNGAVIDSINQYGQVAHMIVNTSMGVSKKYGVAQSWGYTTASDGNMMYLDGRLIAASATLASVGVGGPLVGTLLSSAEKNIPLFAMGQIRLQFTIDTLANMSFTDGTITALTDFNITDFEVTYQMVDMGAAVEKMVYDMGPQLFIKTHGWNNSSVAVSAGTSGNQTYVFNQRLASIRSAYICPNRPTGSKQVEFVDITSGNGTYQLNVGSQMFPQMPLDTLNNFGGIFVETARAAGAIYGKNSEMAISQAESVIDENDTTASLKYYSPGKFIAGVLLSKVGPDDRDVLMSGCSTYNQPIGVNVNFGTATTNANSLNLMLDYDSVLVLDTGARQLSVRS
jgi:hypothetical protein